MKTKRCCKCKRQMPAEGFCKDKRTRDGLGYRCAECRAQYYLEYNRTHKKDRAARRAATRPHAKQYAHDWILANRARYLVAEARRRCARKGIPFDLDSHVAEIQHRINAGVCEVSGIPLKTTFGPMTFDSPSIDRIVPKLGYVYSNIRIVCRAMNCALGDWGEDVLMLILESWRQKRGEHE